MFGQPIGYIGSFSYSYDQEIQRGRDQGPRRARRDAGDGRAVQHLSRRRPRGTRVLWGGLLNLSTRVGLRHASSPSTTPTPAAPTTRRSDLAGFNEEFSSQPSTSPGSTFTERAVRSNQLLGEHLLGPAHLVDWSVTSRGRDPQRARPLGRRLHRRARARRPALVPGRRGSARPRFATRTFSDLDEHSWDFGGNYRLLLGSLDHPVTLKVGGAYRDRRPRRRHPGLRHRQPRPGRCGAAAGAGRRSSPTANVDASRLHCSTPTPTAGATPPTTGSPPGTLRSSVPLTGRLQLIGGARVEQWHLDVDTLTDAGRDRPRARREQHRRAARRWR